MYTSAHHRYCTNRDCISGLVTSVVRFVEFNRPLTDPMRTAVVLTIWTIVEPGMYTIAACLVALRPLLFHVRHHIPLSVIFTGFSSNKDSADGGKTVMPPEARASWRLHSNEGSSDDMSDAVGLTPAEHGNSEVYILHDMKNDQEQAIPDGIHVHREFSTYSTYK